MVKNTWLESDGSFDTSLSGSTRTSSTASLYAILSAASGPFRDEQHDNAINWVYGQFSCGAREIENTHVASVDSRHNLWQQKFIGAGMYIKQANLDLIQDYKTGF